jgi:alpha-N-arabinofuranosidase
MGIPDALNRARGYDNYDRKKPKIFVGEWATRVPSNADTCNLNAALADAAFLTGLERNADVIVMNCYAPLLVNVNPGARQWAVDLIGYDTLNSFGSPSYYVQKMFSNNRGDAVLPVTLSTVPNVQIPVPPRRGPGAPVTNASTQPTMQSAPGVFVSAARDETSGDVILKLVNYQESAQPLNIEIQGAAQVGKDAAAEVLSGTGEEMNTIAEPMKMVPHRTQVAIGGPKFSYELAAKSVTVLRIPK